jgi:thioredoxin-related protein
MLNLKISPILLIAMLCVSSMTFAAGINFQKLTLEQGIEKAKKENKKLFIDVYATWCGPCKYLDKNTFTDQDLGGFINENYIALKLDGEKEDGESLMLKFNLESYPSMLFLDADLTLLKKVVGAVEAYTLLTNAKDVMYPEEAEIYKLKVKYDVGVRDREFMQSLILATLNDNQSADVYVFEYLELYPDLDLFEEKDFMMFYIGINDLDDKRTTFFLENIRDLTEVYREATLDKLSMIFYRLVEHAVEKEDRTLITKGLDLLYGPYTQALDGDALGKAELLEALQAGYDEEIEG